MSMGNQGVDGVIPVSPVNIAPIAAYTALGNNTSGSAAPTALTGQINNWGLVTVTDATTTGQVLVDIAGLSVACAINSVYEFEAVLSVTTSADTTGTEYGVQYSVAGGAVEAHITGALTSTASKTERISALNTATGAFLTTSAQSGGVLIKGIVTTGVNAGNLTIRHLKVTSGTSTVRINSFLRVIKVA